MKQTKIDFNLKGLDNFKEQADQYRARVGVLGSHAARTDDSGLSNADIGFIQMFGSVSQKIPPRDFLISPIEMHKREILKALQTNAVKKLIEEKNFKKIYEYLGIAGLQYVQEAFETAGFGQWPANAPSTIARKKSAQPLIAKGELKDSITSDVVKKSEAEGAVAHV